MLRSFVNAIQGIGAFNILMHEGVPWFIDFSEAIRVDRTGASPWHRLNRASVALRQGMCALRTYIERFGLEINAEENVSCVVKSLDKFDVLD